MEHPPTQPPQHPPQPPRGTPRRIIIIGGGVAGLTLALALKQLSQRYSLDLEPVIYEATTTYTDRGPHYLLWKWAVQGLLELGLGKRLGRISWPVVKLTSVDAATKEELVSWPPAAGFAADAATSTAGGTRAGSGTAGVAAAVAAAEAEAGVRASTDPYSYLPPLLGLRKPDLLRLLMTALAGREDLVADGELAVRGANNNDFAFYSEAKRARADAAASNPALASASMASLALPPTQIPDGLEGDLAHANWFVDEGFDRLLPNLHMGFELDSYVISASTGTVSVRFTNGATDTGFMLVGADGLYSKVRELMTSGRVPVQHAGSAIFTGISRVYMPPADAPTELETGAPVPMLSRDAVLRFCPDGSARTFVDRGLSFGVANIGNGFLGWNMIVAQQGPGQVVGDYVRTRRRRQVGSAIASMGKGVGGIAGLTVDGAFIRRDLSSSSVDEWMVPDRNSSTTSLAAEPTGGAGGAAPAAPGAPASTLTPPPPPYPLGGGASHPVIMVPSPDLTHSAPQGQESPFPELMPPTHSRLVRLPAFEDPAHMSGEESRELALRLLGQSAGMPPEALVLVARTDAGFTAAFDNMDLGDKQPESYTSPNFHPGRVVLVGDAAHGVALGAHGSVGGSLAIADAVVLAKLLAQYFKPDAPPVTAETAAAAAAAAAQAASATQASAGVSASATSTISRGLSLGNSVIEALLSPVAAVTGPALAEGAAPVFSDGSDVEKDGLRLKLVAGKFTALRLPAGNASCVNARAETTWTRQDEGFWKNLVRMSVGYTWARSTFSQMLMRGAPTMGDESVTWPALSRFSK